jgi:hypothetical protein
LGGGDFKEQLADIEELLGSRPEPPKWATVLSTNFLGRESWGEGGGEERGGMGRGEQRGGKGREGEGEARRVGSQEKGGERRWGWVKGVACEGLLSITGLRHSDLSRIVSPPFLLQAWLAEMKKERDEKQDKAKAAALAQAQ